MTPEEFLAAFLRYVHDVSPENPLDHLHRYADEHGFDLHELAPPPDGK